MGGKVKTSWKKGQSGNPKGRPPLGESMTELMEAKIGKDKILEKLDELIDKGDFNAIKLAMNYMFNLPVARSINATVQVDSLKEWIKQQEYEEEEE